MHHTIIHPYIDTPSAKTCYEQTYRSFSRTFRTHNTAPGYDKPRGRDAFAGPTPIVHESVACHESLDFARDRRAGSQLARAGPRESNGGGEALWPRLTDALRFEIQGEVKAA